jgi:hypothetical protein
MWKFVTGAKEPPAKKSKKRLPKGASGDDEYIMMRKLTDIDKIRVITGNVIGVRFRSNVNNAKVPMIVYLKSFIFITGDNRMVVTEVTTIPTWRAQKQARSVFLIFSVQTYVHEKLLSCTLDKNVFNDPL